MLEVIAAVNDEAVLRANLLRSPLLSRPGVVFRPQRGFGSASLAFRHAMEGGVAPTLVFVHQDVYLPRGWEQCLRGQIARVEAVDPRWAVLGLYGVGVSGMQAGCLWSSGAQSLFGAPFDVPVAAQSLDEVLIVMRRASGVRFDAALPGFHLYATDLVQTARAAGLGAWVICAPVVHNSRPLPFLGADYFRAYRYMARKWRGRLPIAGNVASLMPPGPGYLALRLRHALIGTVDPRARRGRHDRGLDCVEVAHRLEFE
jgi:hypothetical protein